MIASVKIQAIPKVRDCIFGGSRSTNLCHLLYQLESKTDQTMESRHIWCLNPHQMHSKSHLL